MRVFRVKAFESVPSFHAIMASVSNDVIEETVEFMSVGYEVEEHPAVVENTVTVQEVLVQEVSIQEEETTCKVQEVSMDVDELVVPEDVMAEEEDALYDEEALYLDDFNTDLDVSGVEFTGLAPLRDCEALQSVFKTPCTDIVPATSEGSSTAGPSNAPLGKGFRAAPDQGLVKAGEGEERTKSFKNDRWSARRADQLRSSLGWDMSIQLGDLDFKELDGLLSDLFTRVVKVNGKDYPSESLMNMLGGFNMIIRRASEVRDVKGNLKAHDPLPKDFNIKHHFAFPRTRLVLRAAVQKSAKEGCNKKRVKVGTVTLEMEIAIKLDHEHQITDSTGCQKRLALYLVLWLGIRGGIELWSLHRKDLKLLFDGSGREYIAFEERDSKNNTTTLDRTKEEQFRQTFYTYEEDFILTLKQYFRHLPPLGDGVKSDLFMQPINHPAGLIWYNKVTKVSERVCGQYLKNMMLLVGLSPDLIASNKSGRVTLITRMAACGVPDAMGCLVTGHHTTDGYGRYDRTKELKMEAAILTGCNPGLSYESALSQVSKKFMEEKIIGTSTGLRPLLNQATLEKEADMRKEMREQLKGSMGHMLVSESSTTTTQAEFKNKLKRPLEVACIEQRQVLQLGDPSAAQVSPMLQQKLTASHQDYDMIDWEREFERNPSLARALSKAVDYRAKQLATWHSDYDDINWDEEARRNPTLARHLGSRSALVQTFSGNTFSNLSNCTIQICVGGSRDGVDANHNDNKENKPGVNNSTNSKS